MTTLAPKMEELCAQDTWDFSDLEAFFINTTLKKSPELSHTPGLMDISAEIMRRQVIGTPIWLGEKSSVCATVIERLYENSGMLNQHGQYAYYGRAGGCRVTGNEDGIKHCSMAILYALQHLGYAIPPQPTPGGSVRRGRGPHISTRGPGARRTTSPIATPRS